eukprot:scaffold51448_cov64-Phaeocystis_antarctica.AAC.6
MATSPLAASPSPSARSSAQKSAVGAAVKRTWVGARGAVEFYSRRGSRGLQPATCGVASGNPWGCSPSRLGAAPCCCPPGGAASACAHAASGGRTPRRPPRPRAAAPPRRTAGRPQWGSLRARRAL